MEILKETSPTNPANYRDINWEPLEAKPSRGLDGSVDVLSPVAAVIADIKEQENWLRFVATVDSQSK